MISVPLERSVTGVGRQFAVALTSEPTPAPALAGAVAWIAVALVVGSILLLGWPRSTRAIHEKLSARPDIAFAIGFIVWFGLLVLSLAPAIAGTILASQSLTTLSAIVMLPGLLACGVLAIGGGCIAVIGVGDRLYGAARGETESRWPALLVGTAVLGAAQLVPILGALVTIGAAVFGTGAVVLAKWGDALVSSADDQAPDESDHGGSVDSHHGWIADAESSVDSTTRTRARAKATASTGTNGTNPDSRTGWETTSSGSGDGDGDDDDDDDGTATTPMRDETRTDAWAETGFRAAQPRSPSSDETGTSRDSRDDQRDDATQQHPREDPENDVSR